MPQQTGLTQKQAQRLLEQNGPNELQGKKGENLAALFFSQFKDVMILILAAATLISLFMGQTAEAAAILLIVLLNALLGFLQEMRTEKTLQALEQLGAPTAWAMRDASGFSCRPGNWWKGIGYGCRPATAFPPTAGWNRQWG